MESSSRHICKKLRYLLNPKHTPFFTCQSVSPKTLISPVYPNNAKPTRLLYRPFSTPPPPPRRGFSQKPKFTRTPSEVILEVIKKDEDDMETELNKMNPTLSLDFVTQIFWGLNASGVSGLRFFVWVREKHSSFNRNANFSSLLIDNLGRVQDYHSMFLALKGFSRDTICLTENAFAFLLVFTSSNRVMATRDCVLKILRMLDNVGGSCRNSGVFALIKMLCNVDCFDLAVLVMEETSRTTSYYNVMIWAKCRTCDFQEAYDLYDEMRGFGCDPNSNSYNYLLGSLCKNERIGEACNLFQKMEEFGYYPDAVTFEVIICHACRLGRLDFAAEFLYQMISRGIEPRDSTHAAIIKGYFYCNGFREAYKYVIDMYDRSKCAGNMNYSLLASLLQRSKRAVEAQEVLVDMIEKGLKPNFPVYMKVTKDLYKSGKGYMVANLKNRYSKFDSKTNNV